MEYKTAKMGEVVVFHKLMEDLQYRVSHTRDKTPIHKFIAVCSGISLEQDIIDNDETQTKKDATGLERKV